MKFIFFWILSTALLQFILVNAATKSNPAINFSDRKNIATKGIGQIDATATMK